MSASRANLQALAKIAGADVTSGRAMSAKLRALLLLVEAGRRSPIPRSRMRAELHAIIATELLGGRQLEAAVRAIEALERFDAPRPRKARRLAPASTAPAGYWHPEPAGSAWRELDAGDTIAVREAWQRRLSRPGPWREPHPGDMTHP